MVSPLQEGCRWKEQYNWPERTDARVGLLRAGELGWSYVPGSHPGPGRCAVAVVSSYVALLGCALCRRLKVQTLGFRGD